MDTSGLKVIREHCRKVSTEILNMSGELECHLEPLADGLNFMSDAFFAEVKNESKETSMFVKVPPQSNNIRQKLFETIPKESNLFQREFCFYNSVQDLFKEVVEDENEDAEELMSFLPKPLTLPGRLSHSRGLEEPLAFENLASSGYRMWNDEFRGLDLNHAEVCMETFGKLHALGLVLFDKKDMDDDMFAKLLDHDISIMFDGPVLGIIDKGMQAFREWMVNNGQNVQKLDDESCERKYIETVRKLYAEGKEHKMQVVAHGDARSNNILFKYAEDKIKPVGAKLVDFQNAFFFNPLFDLIYFFLLSVSADVLIPNYQPLLNRYHSSLVSALTRLNSTHLNPSISDISKNIIHFAPMALPFVCGAIDVLSGVGNPDLNPELRKGKFRSAVQLCQYFEII